MKKKRGNSYKEELITGSLFFTLGLIIIIFFWRNNLLLTFVALLCTLFAYKYAFNISDVKLFFIGAIIGPIGEIIAIHFGVWQYTNPSFLGIPIWLPLAWGNAVVAMQWIAGVKSQKWKNMML